MRVSSEASHIEASIDVQIKIMPLNTLSGQRRGDIDRLVWFVRSGKTRVLLFNPCRNHMNYVLHASENSSPC